MNTAFFHYCPHCGVELTQYRKRHILEGQLDNRPVSLIYCDSCKDDKDIKLVFKLLNTKEEV